uniref:C2H2-type domain-containing protein n=1 Tax=Brassica oleracea var. oleracea TaxID=109376 RepID=A0A0D3B754_BRAOL
MESGALRDKCDTLRHVTNPHGIRVPSSVFLLSGGLHNESTQKVAGAPGVAEELFEARQSALAMEKGKSDERPMLYTCRVCGKGYRSSKAHEQHCKSWRHVLRVSQGTASNGDEDVEADSDEELADADEEEASDSLSKLNVNEPGAGGEDDADMHKHHGFFFFLSNKHHGFFVPNVEYLKYPEGLLTYLGLKVKRDFMCLYCSDLCHAFSSLEAVRKHMEAKIHCKLHYSDKKRS